MLEKKQTDNNNEHIFEPKKRPNEYENLEERLRIMVKTGEQDKISIFKSLKILVQEIKEFDERNEQRFEPKNKIYRYVEEPSIEENVINDEFPRTFFL